MRRTDYQPIVLSILTLCCLANIPGASAHNISGSTLQDRAKTLTSSITLSSQDKQGLHVRFSGSKNAELEGVKCGRVMWKQAFPLQEPINEHHTSVQYVDDKIVLIYPATKRSYANVQVFSWNGNDLKFVNGAAVLRTSPDSTGVKIAQLIDSSKR